MTIVIGRRGILGDLQGDIARLERLLVDLRHLAMGHLPTEMNVDVAPLLEHWAEATRTELCLVGRVIGRPASIGPVIGTSGLWVHAPELGWTRTLSGFYRLGRPQ